MMRSWVIAATLAGTMSASASYAADPVVAKLESGTTERIKVIAAGAMFDCAGSECVSAAPSGRMISLEACKVLARRLGRIQSLSDSRHALPAEKLATCNQVAARR
jgi:hypothetical protein